ncbi:VOC family protein [Methanobacterium sp. ACI-7]|uniref:VOC family protein n=1 Tax=unclassified Methanobacterium TaxID=2627676 RepID=UPI0039C33F4B
MQKITPFLWFDNQAEEAMNFYVSVFKNSKVISVTRYRKDAPGPEGTVMTAKFRIEGQEFVALNGGPQFNFTEVISFVVNCKTQEEIDYYWEKLSNGGAEQGPGWIKDKYGLSWQVIPVLLEEMMGDEDPEKSGRVMNAMMQMTKIDIKKLKQAYNGE